MEKQIREIIAQHVGGTYEAKQKCAEEILRLFSVVGRREQLPCSECSDNGGGVTDDGWEKCDCGSTDIKGTDYGFFKCNDCKNEWDLAN